MKNLILIFILIFSFFFTSCNNNEYEKLDIEKINNSLYTKYIYQNQINKHYIEEYEIIKLNIENDTCFIWKGQNGRMGGISCK